MNGLYEEIRIALHGIWHRRWLALGVAWGICLLGWLGLALIPNSYQSKAKVFVQMNNILSGDLGTLPADQQKDFDRVRQTLTSQDNLEKVVRATDLGTGLSAAQVSGKAAGLRERIKIASTADNLFDISATWSDSSRTDAANARLSTAIVQKVIDIFVEENLSGDKAETSQTLKFLDQQIADRGRQLAQAEARLAEFERKYMGVLPGTGTIADRMAAARNEINQIDAQLIPAQSALSAANAQLAGTPANLTSGGGGGGNPALAAAQTELAQARSRGWTDQHPDVIALKQQIAALRSMGGGAGGATMTPNPVFMQVKSQQMQAQATVSALGARKAKIQNDMNTILAAQASDPAVAGEQSQISRDYNVLKDQYDKLVAERERARIKGDVEQQTDSVRFQIIDPPSVPSGPAAPNRPLLLVGLLIVGIGGGVAAAFAMGQLQTTYPTAQRLEKASGLPVLGTISETVTDSARVIAKQRLRWFMGASGGLAGLCVLLVAVEFIQRGLGA